MLLIRIIHLRLVLVALLTLGLILAPVLPDIALAAEGAGAAGAGPDTEPAGTAAGAATGAATGAGVSGPPSGKPAGAGKGALAPPKGADAQKPPVKSADKKPKKTDEPQKVPKGIAASAGTVGKPAAASGGGISLGWKIAGGVLGVGLLVGLAGGGGSSGGGTTPSH